MLLTNSAAAVSRRIVIGPCCCSQLWAPAISVQPTRNQWLFSHVYLPERTPEGKPQRKPSEHPDFMKYVAVFNPEFLKPGPPVKLILMEEIEGIGGMYDVVELPTREGRPLIWQKKAVYASSFDLEYYARKKKEIQAELDRKVRIPAEFLEYARIFMDQVVPLIVSADHEWTLDREIVVKSLLQKDIRITDPSIIHLTAKKPSGPDPAIEASLVRFYITLDDKMVVPVLGRIKHVSEKLDKENLFPEAIDQLSRPDAEQLAKFGLLPEVPYYNPKGMAEVIDDIGNVKDADQQEESGGSTRVETFMVEWYQQQKTMKGDDDDGKRVGENERTAEKLSKG